MDYRYFPDPDLLPLEITAATIERIRSSMPELPQAMRARFESAFGLSAYDANALTASRTLASYFESTLSAFGGEAKLVANWVSGDLLGRLNEAGLEAAAAPVAPGQLAGLLKRIDDGTISGKMAKDVFAALWQDAAQGRSTSADAVIEARGLKQLSDVGAIEKIIDDVLKANSISVEEFRAGREKAFNALVGQVMKATMGRANPAQVNEILRHKLAA